MLSTYLFFAFVNYAENSNRTRQLAVKITIVLKILRRAPATESTSRSSPPEQHPFRRHRIHIEVVATRFETAVTIGIDQIIRRAYGQNHLDHVKLVACPVYQKGFLATKKKKNNRLIAGAGGHLRFRMYPAGIQ